jgi:hypothetical protein
MGRFLLRIWAAIPLFLTVGLTIWGGFDTHSNPVAGFFVGFFLSLGLLVVGLFFYGLLKIIFGSDA